ncbi:[FeFe] hydrogenase H-cluster radical SAM maturase HydE [Candidatus Micrarchaeota archaeon]|nr:[FeFe] hydrogenase H-cluster radical SAM maturase HydE [Candidatus Micrarchaeota archaeon]
MCYAIPGKVVSVDNKTVTVDYFGELRKAHIIDTMVQPREYVYAQGGIVVGKISENEALPILETWKDHFFELKKIDAGLSILDKVSFPILKKVETLTKNEMLTLLAVEDKSELDSFYHTANKIRKERLDNACCVHGILEFSNYCSNNCLYCGINCSNKSIERYRMSEKEILDAVDYAVQLGFKALVLQSGEDLYYTDGMLVNIVKKIRKKHGILLFMSIGERSKDSYKKLYEAGAYGALLRFETGNSKLYTHLRPGKKLEDRLQLICELNNIGFVIATGFLIGLPNQTKKDIINDILLTKSLQPDMYSFGPLIPHPATPLTSVPKPTLDDILKVIALTRIVDPEAKILVTTALETLSFDAKEKGLMAGGNSLMINITPQKFKKSYDLYPGKVIDEPLEETVKKTVGLLHSLGRAPTDLGV